MILKLNGKEMDQQPRVNVKYIEQLRELARPVVKTAKVLSGLCNSDIYNCELSPVIEYFTKRLADYLDGQYDIDDMVRCSDWYDENILPNCLDIIMSDGPVQESIREKYEKPLEERLCRDLAYAKQQGGYCGLY